MNELFVVPAERHVERLAVQGISSVTRAELRARLTVALLPSVAFADAVECRLALAAALAEDPAVGGPVQLGLFGPTGETTTPRKSQLLEPLRVRGGAAWARTLAALDGAIGKLNARGLTPEMLERAFARRDGVAAARARTLAAAMRAHTQRLARAGRSDARRQGHLLAEAIASADAHALETAVSARRFRARWILSWDPADLAWWRALDQRLTPLGGGARIVLPTFDRPLDGEKELDPFDAIAERVARGIDGAPESEHVAPVLGWLTEGVTSARDADVTRLRLVRSTDAGSQARIAAHAVARALHDGAPVERVVVAVPTHSDATIAPLRRALDDMGIATFDPKADPPAQTPVVAAAMLALEAALTFDRKDVARLLRSGYVDGYRLMRGGSDAIVTALARALEHSPTAAGATPLERFLRTVELRAARDPFMVHDERVDAMALALGNMLSAAGRAKSRREWTHAARTLWTDLGIGMRAGRGGLRTFSSDEAPVGVARAERHSIARDSRAWDALFAALESYENAAQRTGAGDLPVQIDAFQLEVLDVLDRARSLPSAGRVGAVRIARIEDIGGDELELLVVLDVNDGQLPARDSDEAFLSEALEEVLDRIPHDASAGQRVTEVAAEQLGSLALAASEARAIVLCFVTEDRTGAPALPSRIVEALAQAGTTVEVTSLRGHYEDGNDTARRAAREREREGFFLDPERPRSDVVGAIALSPLAASIVTTETGGAEKALAVTGLERFARCPFLGFSHVVLAARESTDAEELPDAREEGIVAHEVLAAAFCATRDLWPIRPRPRDEIMHRGLRVADELLDRWRGHAPLRVVACLRIRDAARAVLTAAVDDLSWNFDSAEQPFGMKTPSSWPALTFVDARGHLHLRGTIDRLDRAPSGEAARVVDYKRSKSTVQSASRTLGETTLQVPLYASAASKALDVPVTGLYLAFQARDVPSTLKASPTATTRMAELLVRQEGERSGIEERALAVAASARTGMFAPTPALESECRTCPASGGCRKPRFAMAPLDDVEDLV